MAENLNDELADELSVACAIGDIATVEKLLDDKTKNLVDAKGWHPIHWAAQEGHLKIVDLLLANGVDANIRTVSERLTPLMLSVCCVDDRVVQRLLAGGADPNLTSSFLGGSSALHTAAAYNKDEVARMLICFGASTYLLDDSGESPVDLAVINNAREVLNVLELKWRDVDK